MMKPAAADEGPDRDELGLPVKAIAELSDPADTSDEGPDWWAALTCPQRAAASMIVAGFELGRVAVALKVNETTLRNWRELPEFRLAVARLAGEDWETIRHQILSLSAAAVGFLGEVLNDPDRPTRDRLRAAELLIKAAANPETRPLTRGDLGAIKKYIARGY